MKSILVSRYMTSGFDDSTQFPNPSQYDFSGINSNGVFWFTKVKSEQSIESHLYINGFSVVSK